MRILIAGCGWLGRSLGQQLIRDGQQVLGVCRSADSCQLVEATGIPALQLDLSDPAALATLPEDISGIVACQAAASGAAEAYRQAYVTVTSHLLDRFSEPGSSAVRRRFVFVGRSCLDYQ